MRKGKMIAQGAHASLGAVELIHERGWSAAHIHWTRHGTTKICVSVDSGEELLRIYNLAKDSLPVYMVTDSGKTEFDGIPTITCLAIGPYWADEIDKITGELKLL